MASGLFFESFFIDSRYFPYFLQMLQYPWIQFTVKVDAELRNNNLYYYSVIELFSNFTLYVLIPCFLNFIILWFVFRVFRFFLEKGVGHLDAA